MLPQFTFAFVVAVALLVVIPKENTMKKVIGFLVVGCLTITLWNVHKARKIRSVFEKASYVAEDDLRRQLGAPWRRGPCGKEFGGTVPANCKVEVIYRSPYAPDFWAFRFDGDGKFIDKYEYILP